MSQGLGIHLNPTNWTDMLYLQLMQKRRCLMEQVNFEIPGTEEYEALMQQIKDIDDHNNGIA